MPVLPEVGSMMVLFPGDIFPAASACSIILIPILSFTDPPGLKNSHFTRRSHLRPLMGCSLVLMAQNDHMVVIMIQEREQPKPSAFIILEHLISGVLPIVVKTLSSIPSRRLITDGRFFSTRKSFVHISCDQNVSFS